MYGMTDTSAGGNSFSPNPFMGDPASGSMDVDTVTKSLLDLLSGLDDRPSEQVHAEQLLKDKRTNDMLKNFIAEFLRARQTNNQQYPYP